MLVTTIGFLTSNVIGKKVFGWIQKILNRVPLISLLYSSIRDLVGAFVGEKRNFDQPVVVDLLPEQGVKVLGFLTYSDFKEASLKDRVAVYVPQSYNIAGNLLMVPRERVSPMQSDSAALMAFIVSGGVAGFNKKRLSES